ncbi:FkbM family methyltransferase [Roseomonas populi]|uniref:FkbM family methyltransferase n=1 Tax=Roseomonas populi TaxID=3121582 RepID=A0ABT1XBR1_9PROT|nr:FkbM family methyltransferase [Roseomonas pecuniae]MCR0985557.1 FkbM family methyltransferase [Roseomonas pecuniae]
MTIYPEGRANKEVHVGPDGELFLATNNILEIAFGEVAPQERYLDVFKRNIEARRDFCTAFGIRYLHVVSPDKHNVYRHSFGDRIKFCLANFFGERTQVDFLYPADHLRSFLPKRVYKRNDTHWTSFGTAQVCALMAKQVGLPAEQVGLGLDEMLASIRPETVEEVGDLASKMTVQEVEHIPVVNRAWESLTLTNNLQAGNDGAVVLVLSRHARSRGRLIIFGDSFLRDSLDFLSVYFREVFFCRSRFLHKEIVAQAQPDYVITENAERYLGYVQPDSEAPPCFMIAPLLAREVDYSVETAAALSSFLNPDCKRFKNILQEKTGWTAYDAQAGDENHKNIESLPEKMRLFRSLQESGKLRAVLSALDRQEPASPLASKLHDLLGEAEPDLDPAESTIIAGLVDQGKVCFDVGAGSGAYSILLGQRVGVEGQVYAFEPAPLNRAYLQRRISDLRLSQITVEPLLISNRMRALTAPGIDVPGQAAGVPSASDIQEMTLDHYVTQTKMARIDLVRLGAGTQAGSVLQGSFNLIAKHRPYIIMQVAYEAGADPKQLERSLNLLRMAGYTLCAIRSKPWPHVKLFPKPDYGQPFRTTLFCYHGPRNDAHS